MSAGGLRTVLCCAVSGAGLWGVAAGALAHHPWWVKIGAAAAAIGAALVFTGPADASNFDGLPAPMSAFPVGVQRPPASYQLGAIFVVHTMPSYEIADVCRTLGSKGNALACETDRAVYMPNPCEFRGDRYAELLCHEQAHAEGWPANHPERSQ